eukprot:350547_1
MTPYVTDDANSNRACAVLFHGSATLTIVCNITHAFHIQYPAPRFDSTISLFTVQQCIWPWIGEQGRIWCSNCVKNVFHKLQCCCDCFYSISKDEHRLNLIYARDFYD